MRLEDIEVHVGGLDATTYDYLGDVKAKIASGLLIFSLFNRARTVEEVNLALKEVVVRSHPRASAIVDVSYSRGIGWFSWKVLRARGKAVVLHGLAPGGLAQPDVQARPERTLPAHSHDRMVSDEELLPHLQDAHDSVWLAFPSRAIPSEEFQSVHRSAHGEPQVFDEGMRLLGNGEFGGFDLDGAAIVIVARDIYEAARYAEYFPGEPVADVVEFRGSLRP